MNSIFFRLINTKNTFFIFGYWLLPKKFSFCPKNNGFAQVWGLQPPGLYAYDDSSRSSRNDMLAFLTDCSNYILLPITAMVTSQTLVEGLEV